MNKIIIVGNLTKDVELAQTAKGTAYCNFSVAVKRAMTDTQGNKLTDFFNCTAWKQKAETIAKYCKKGNRVLVEGEMNSNTFTNKDGLKQTNWNIVVLNIEFLGGKQDDNSENQESNNNDTSAKATRKREPMEEIDDRLPF